MIQHAEGSLDLLKEEGSPVSHGHLFQHGRAGVGLPVTRYGSSPESCQTRICSSVSEDLDTLQNLSMHVHVSFVVGTDLLDSDVVFGVDEWFRGGVGLGQSHDASYVLELHVVLHLHLDKEEKLCVHQSARRGQRG